MGFGSKISRYSRRYPDRSVKEKEKERKNNAANLSTLLEPARA
jgi:hypothetical protein